MTSLVVQSTVVRHKIKNISANNEAMRLKLGRDETYLYSLLLYVQYMTYI